MKEGLEKYIGGYTKDKDLVEAKYLAVFPQEAPSESSVEETEEEETTKEKIFEGRQFVFINYDENDAAFHLAKGAKALVKVRKLHLLCNCNVEHENKLLF